MQGTRDRRIKSLSQCPMIATRFFSHFLLPLCAFPLSKNGSDTFNLSLWHHALILTYYLLQWEGEGIFYPPSSSRYLWLKVAMQNFTGTNMYKISGTFEVRSDQNMAPTIREKIKQKYLSHPLCMGKFSNATL